MRTGRKVDRAAHPMFDSILEYESVSDELH